MIICSASQIWHEQYTRTGLQQHDLILQYHSCITIKSYLDKSFPYFSFIFSFPVFVSYAQISRTHPQITEWFRRRNHIEWYRQSTTIIHIIHPQLCPRKLPLYITVTLLYIRYYNILSSQMVKTFKIMYICIHILGKVLLNY